MSPSTRPLIRLHAWNDERAAIVRQYHECVRVLDREPGVPPLEETPSRPHHHGTHGRAGPRDPLVGRDTRAGRTHRSARRYRARRSLVVIEGKPGIAERACSPRPSGLPPTRWATSRPHHRLRRLVADAERTGVATTLRLAPLTSAEVTELVDELDLPDSAALARLLHVETDGVPFFLLAYLDEILDGRLPADTCRTLMPGGVRGLLRARLGALSEIGR